ncbi:hypothetical protein [Natronorubrum sp. FCH18a]|uniref:hypothetical protein n=1 Tax=Natronorubrum sp. FCH18a TaxID=3447018 RepID=UPI003F5113AE
MSGSSDDVPSSSGPPDRQTLRLLERRLANDPLVTRTEYRPDNDEPRVFEGHVDAERYPPSIEAARLDVRWFTTGDFTLHFVETAATGDRWECRWDRHPNSHNSRLHFHRPPSGNDIVDLELPPPHPLDVLSTVLAAVEGRIERAWSEDAA